MYVCVFVYQDPYTYIFAKSLTMNICVCMWAYVGRNETTYFDNVQYVWEAGNAVDLNGFNVHIRVRIPVEVRHQSNDPRDIRAPLWPFITHTHANLVPLSQLFVSSSRLWPCHSLTHTFLS